MIEKRIEIKSLPYTKLLKLEIPDLAKQVIRIVGLNDIEELQIEEMYDLLVAEKEQISNLKVPYGKHPLTQQLKPLREKLYLSVSSLKLEVRMASKSTTRLTEESLIVVQTAVDRYLGDLRNSSKNEVVLNQKVAQFFEGLAFDSELSAALDSLNLMEHLNKLDNAYKEVKSMLDKRHNLISKRPKEKSADFTKSVLTGVRNLFKQIDVAQVKNSELDYKPMIAELNDLLDHYRYLINVRAAYNKRLAEKKDGVTTDETDTTDKLDSKPAETDETTQESEVSVFSMQGGLHPEVKQMNSNGINEDLDQSLDQKKTAAMSTKLVQLPSIENKDMKDANPLV